MKRYFCWLACLICATCAPLQAQTPARPVDPHQALPAQPVQQQPASPASASTPPPAPDPAASSQPTLAVMADSSLRQVLQELLQSWADAIESNPKVALTLTNAGTIRAKVESEPTVDLILSADLADVKEMTAKGLLSSEGQHLMARNTLVIYGRKALVKDDELEWFDLIGTEWKKVAMGNPDLVGSGRLAKRALQKHGLFNEEHKSTFVYAGTELLAMQVVAREQADAVFIYKSDLAQISAPGFEAMAIKSEDAPPVFYTAAVCRSSKNEYLARAFIEFCGSEPAKEIWARHGFETN